MVNLARYQCNLPIMRKTGFCLGGGFGASYWAPSGKLSVFGGSAISSLVPEYGYTVKVVYNGIVLSGYVHGHMHIHSLAQLAPEKKLIGHGSPSAYLPRLFKLVKRLKTRRRD